MPNAPACSCHSNREMTNKPFDGLFEFEQASGLVNQFLLSSFEKVTFLEKDFAREQKEEKLMELKVKV